MSLGVAVVFEGLGNAQINSPGFTYVSPWSDPVSWPDSVLPQEGDDVTIGPDSSILLDCSPLPLQHLLVHGRLFVDGTQVSNDAFLE